MIKTHKHIFINHSNDPMATIVPPDNICESLPHFIERFSNDALKKLLHEHSHIAKMLYSIAFYAPYLERIMIKEESFLLEFLQGHPEHIIDNLLTYIQEIHVESINEDTLRQILRIHKTQLGLGLAILEITHYISPKTMCNYWSQFADIAVNLCVEWLILQYFGCNTTSSHKTSVSHSINPQESGYFILALGKLGGKELNYSSDIDLVVFFNPSRFWQYNQKPVFTKTNDNTPAHTLYKTWLKLTKHLVDLFEKNDVNGYVFRIDLRLRPDPGTTQIAISTDAALNYYEAQGQNWERSAYIKARFIAGDKEAETDFLKELYPFIWRKNIDFSALDDIHAMKEKIHAHKTNTMPQTETNLLGLNIKLCRGGIRDIEFFVNAQQLLLGGRIEALRNRPTCVNLQHLLNHHHISQKCHDELTHAYWFLRTIEHRIQMIHDLQTHNIPQSPDAALSLAHFCGYHDIKTFFLAIQEHQKNVHANYQELFDKIPTTENDKNNDLFFLGNDAEYALTQWFKDHHFHNPPNATNIVQNWLMGRYSCVRHTRSRETLYKVFPFILKAFCESEYPDESLSAFDKFLQHLPGGMQIFSLMYANPNLIKLICLIVNLSSEMTHHLCRHTNSLDTLIYNTGLTQEKSKQDYVKQCKNFMHAHKETINTYEDALNFMRQYCNQEKCRIVINFLTLSTDALTTANQFAYLAQAICEEMFALCHQNFETQYGIIKNANVAIIIMGGAGQSILHFQSDLDIILIYECDKTATSQKEPHLTASLYFTRLTQRFISSLNAQTPEGKLYDIDMRLRPSGSTGPIAIHYKSFQDYHQKDAWDWENLALLKATVLGNNSLSQKIRKTIQTLTHTPLTDPQKFIHNIAHIRHKIHDAYATPNSLNIKHNIGGLVDIDFILSYLQRKYLSQYPELDQRYLTELSDQLFKNNIIDKISATHLQKAIHHFLMLRQIFALTKEKRGIQKYEPALQKMICTSMNVKTIQEAVALIKTHNLHIRQFCQKIYQDFYTKKTLSLYK